MSVYTNIPDTNDEYLTITADSYKELAQFGHDFSINETNYLITQQGNGLIVLLPTIDYEDVLSWGVLTVKDMDFFISTCQACFTSYVESKF